MDNHDPLRPAHGLVNGLLIGLTLWALIVLWVIYG